MDLACHYLHPDAKGEDGKFYTGDKRMPHTFGTFVI
jgi:hypothetical protein